MRIVNKVAKQKGGKGTALTEPRGTVKSENLINEDGKFHRNICIHTKTIRTIPEVKPLRLVRCRYEDKSALRITEPHLLAHFPTTTVGVFDMRRKK